MADSESHEPSPHLKQEACCKVCASCAMGRELHASSHHTSQCRRVTAFGGTRMDVILHLTLQSDGKMPCLGTCLAILNAGCFFCS